MSGATLDNADLSNADLNGVDFNNTRDGLTTTVVGTNFAGAILTNAKMTGVDFSNVLNKEMNGSVGALAQHQGAKFDSYNGKQAKLNNVNMSYSDLTGASFKGSDLNTVNLSNCTIKNADLSYADMSNANLSNTLNLEDPNNKLEGLILDGADLTNTGLTKSDVEGFNSGKLVEDQIKFNDNTKWD